MNKYEYYYLFGLDIPLQKHGLGIIKQPKLIDLINNGILIEEIYFPFILNDMLIAKSENKENSIKLRDTVGELTFLLITISQDKSSGLIELFENVLSVLYGTKNIKTTKSFEIIVDDNIIINNSNFNDLREVVFESQGIDKSKLKFEDKTKKELDPIEAKFEFFRSKSKKKKREPEMIDMLNFIIHTTECGLDYNKVLNMTVYQMRNTLETLGYKHNYETMLQYKLSQKFDVKEDIKSWSSKKIVKNSAMNKDV